MTPFSSRTFSKVLWRVLGNFYGKGIGFVATAIISRRLGPAEYGHVRIALSLFAIFLVFSGLQLKTAISTYAAQYPNERRNLYHHGLWLMGAAVVGSLILFVPGLVFFRPVNDLVARDLFLFSFPVIITYQLTETYKEFLQGVGETKAQTLTDMLQGTIKAVFIIGFVWWVGNTSWDWFYGRLIGEVLTMGIMAIIMVKYFRKYFAGQVIRYSRELIKRFLRYYAYSIPGSGLSIIQNELPALLIMWFTSDSSQVAFLGIALLFLSALGMFGQSLTSAVFAEAAKLHRNKSALLMHLWRSQVVGNIIFIPFALLLLMFAKPIVLGIFGPAYAPSVILVQIVLIASMFQNVSYINGGYWLAVGNIRLSTITSVIFFVISTGASIIGMMLNGAVGMAWGILVSRGLISLATVFFSQRYIVKC